MSRSVGLSSLLMQFCTVYILCIFLVLKAVVVYPGGFFSFSVYVKVTKCLFHFFYPIEDGHFKATTSEAFTLHHLCGEELSTLAAYHPLSATQPHRGDVLSRLLPPALWCPAFGVFVFRALAVSGGGKMGSFV